MKILDKIKGTLGCLLMIVILSFIIWAFGRIFNIFSPITVWIPNIKVWMADTGTEKGDSVYIANLHKIADAYYKEDYTKRERRTRRKILNFYKKKEDTLSIDYAVAKVEYLRVMENNEVHSTEIIDAKNILWKNWEARHLNNPQKILLYEAIIMSTQDGTIRENETEFQKALRVAEDMVDSSKEKSVYIQSMLNTLAMLCINDMNRWEEAQTYLERMDVSKIEDPFMKEFYWITMANFQLQLHNTELAMQYLDSAKAVDCHKPFLVIQVTQLQAAIYDATGRTRDADNVRKHIIALKKGNGDNDKWTTTCLNLENAIHKNRKLQARYYFFDLYRQLLTIKDKYKEQDKLTSEEKLGLAKIKDMSTFLSLEYIIHMGPGTDKFTCDSIYEIISELEKSTILPPDKRLKVIDYQIQTALQYPSESSAWMIENGLNELRSRLQKTFSHFTDGEKAAFWRAEEPILRNIYSSTYNGAKYNSALLSKGILLSSSNHVKTAILESGDSLLIRDWNLLQRIKQTEMLNITALNQDDQILKFNVDSLEHSIIRRSKAYQSNYNSWDVRWQDVQEQLRECDCAIEYITYETPSKNSDAKKSLYSKFLSIFNRSSIKNDTAYAALVLRKGDVEPLCIPLCNQTELKIDSDVDPNLIYSTTSNICELIWTPIQQYLPSGNIYISLDGKLHHLNIEALPLTDSTVLADQYSIHRVSSTRELVLNKTANFSASVLYGGINYSKMTSQTTKIDNNSTERGIFWGSSTEHRTSPVDELPNTLLEVNNIENLIQTLSYQPIVLSGEKADESSFKELSGKGKTLLHIATHGVFIETDAEEEIDPMRRWGLLFAGANDAYTGKAIPQGQQDGIATAAEIATLDFRETDLVVLSACKTARGTITSEGVFGLQRAFKQAGVTSIVMSLWNVSDEATKQFMIFLYQSMIDGHSKREALDIARCKLRKQEPNPAHWAAFVLLD